MFETADVTKPGDDTEVGKAMDAAVNAVKAAIEAFIGHECDMAIGVHFHHEAGSPCSALVVTPEGMDVGLAAKTLYLGLGGLQMMMVEMPSPEDTVN